MKRIALGLSAVVLILAGAVGAAEEQSSVARSETRAEAQARAMRMFDKFDLNHDGKLDQADRAVRTNEMFDRLDINHDGSISRAEFAAAHAHETGPDHGGAGQGTGHDDRGGDHMGHWGHGHHGPGGMAMMVMRRADPGHTGTVTRDAFVAAALALFDQADTNHDGVLTPEEHRAATEADRARMQQHGGWHHPPDGDMPAGSPPAGH